MGNKQVHVAVFGLGFVGLPLALSFAMNGARVVGVDTNQTLVDEINSGITYHHEQYRGKTIQEILPEQLEKGSFKATTNGPAALSKCDNIVITVGIPTGSDGQPFTGHLEECIKTVASGLKSGDLVLLRSTVIPGMTRKFVQPLLESGGMRAGRDFYLAFSSERIAEGKAFEEFENMPTLVSGLDEESTRRAKNLLKVVTRAELVEGSSFEAVETAKVIENISRDINVAVVNELARITKAMGLDVFEIIKLANTHKRVSLLKPGPGVGGYCLPNALHYLSPRAWELGVDLKLMRTARQVNDEMPGHVAGLILKLLAVPAAEAKVAVLGLAMKDYSSDDRLSPALRVISLLEKQGVRVAAFDPAVPKDYPFKVQSLQEALKDAHGAVVLALQKGIDFQDLAQFEVLMNREFLPFILDTRDIYRPEDFQGMRLRLERL